MTKKMYTCPCCSNATIDVLGNYEICPVCGWEDDPIQSDDQSFSGGANDLSLIDYRETWLRSFGSRKNRAQQKKPEEKA
jgi:anaerobic ribonucleoside-triphosphate reductase